MVIDTSAVLAILELEPEAERFAQMIEDADTRLISAVSVLEAGIITEARKGHQGADELDMFLQQADVTIYDFDAEQSAVARDAYRRFGKGSHDARLNFGDCATYALARLTGEPLLFKGDDFGHTDLPQLTPDNG